MFRRLETQKCEYSFTPSRNLQPKATSRVSLASVDDTGSVLGRDNITYECRLMYNEPECVANGSLIKVWLSHNASVYVHISAEVPTMLLFPQSKWANPMNNYRTNTATTPMSHPVRLNTALLQPTYQTKLSGNDA